MKSQARLLAARLLEAEPEVPPEPANDNPAAEPGIENPAAEPGVDVRDFILSSDLMRGGVPEPSLYADWKAKLGRRAKVKLERNTYLRWYADDGRIALQYHATAIMVLTPQGILTVSTFGPPNPEHVHGRNYYGYDAPGFGSFSRSWMTSATKDRLDKHLPCKWSIYSIGGTRRGPDTAPRQGAWYWCNSATRSGYWDGEWRIEYTDGDQIDTSTGQLMPQKEPVPIKRRQASGAYGNY